MKKIIAALLIATASAGSANAFGLNLDARQSQILIDFGQKKGGAAAGYYVAVAGVLCNHEEGIAIKADQLQHKVLFMDGTHEIVYNYKDFASGRDYGIAIDFNGKAVYSRVFIAGSNVLVDFAGTVFETCTPDDAAKFIPSDER